MLHAPLQHIVAALLHIQLVFSQLQTCSQVNVKLALWGVTQHYSSPTHVHVKYKSQAQSFFSKLRELLFDSQTIYMYMYMYSLLLISTFFKWKLAKAQGDGNAYAHFWNCLISLFISSGVVNTCTAVQYMCVTFYMTLCVYYQTMENSNWNGPGLCGELWIYLF